MGSVLYRQLRITKMNWIGCARCRCCSVLRDLPQTSSACDPERYILEKKDVIRDYTG